MVFMRFLKSSGNSLRFIFIGSHFYFDNVLKAVLENESLLRRKFLGAQQRKKLVWSLKTE